MQTICLTLWSKTLRQRGRCKKRTAVAVVHMKLANNRFGNQLEDRAVSWVQQRDKPGERKPPMMILVRKQKLLQRSSALCKILQKTVRCRKNKGDKGGDASSWWESLERSVCMTGRAKGGCFSVWRCCAALADLQGEAVIVFFYLQVTQRHYYCSIILLMSALYLNTFTLENTKWIKKFVFFFCLIF